MPSFDTALANILLEKATNPERIAMLQGILGNALYKKGMLDEAIEHYKEALSIYRRLAQQDQRFLPDVANSLFALGLALRESGEERGVDLMVESARILAGLIRAGFCYLSWRLEDFSRVLERLLDEKKRKEVSRIVRDALEKCR